MVFIVIDEYGVRQRPLIPSCAESIPTARTCALPSGYADALVFTRVAAWGGAEAAGGGLGAVTPDPCLHSPADSCPKETSDEMAVSPDVPLSPRIHAGDPIQCWSGTGDPW